MFPYIGIASHMEDATSSTSTGDSAAAGGNAMDGDNEELIAKRACLEILRI